MFATRGFFKRFKEENYIDYQLARNKEQLLKDCPSMKKEEKAKSIDGSNERVKSTLRKHF